MESRTSALPRRSAALLRSLALLFLVSIAVTGAVAQTPPSDLEGEAFRAWLKETYYDGKHTELGYSLARDRMYNYIDNKNNTITCVYGGYEQYREYGSSGTDVWPINAEHTVPQSFFSKNEPMRSDIHHLFPTYNEWNSRRGSYPFADIPDDETELWMIDTTSSSQAPSSNRDAYSEYKQGYFEPPENHKGDVARAVFYFYTMYPSYDINRVASPDLLYQWSEQDPPDQKELDRNDMIEQFQGNRNPYVDHPEWVARAWGFAPAPGPEELFNGDTRQVNLAYGEFAEFFTTLPSSAASFTVSISGTGNGDLYVRRGSTIAIPEDLGVHDTEDFKAPNEVDSEETVFWSSPISDTYYITVYGSSDGTDVDLNLDWAP